MKFLLKEVQSTRTQRPVAGSSYPYVEIMLGDLTSQRITQLQVDQVRDVDFERCYIRKHNLGKGFCGTL